LTDRRALGLLFLAVSFFRSLLNLFELGGNGLLLILLLSSELSIASRLLLLSYVRDVLHGEVVLGLRFLLHSCEFGILLGVLDFVRRFQLLGTSLGLLCLL